MTNKAIFWYYYKKIPKGKRFIRWTKKKEPQQSDEIERLCKEYNISPREAKLSVE